MNPIPNDQLTLDAVPSPAATWQVISDFAHTFDGYEHWGSFEKCADIANNKRSRTLTDLRTCLFFEQRRWRHFGDSPDSEDMEYIRGLVEQIRGKVQAGELD